MRKLFTLLLSAVLLFAAQGLSAQSLTGGSNNGVGRIESNGTIRNSSGNSIGSVRSGDVRNSSGNTIGHYSGVKDQWAAIFFFFW